MKSQEQATDTPLVSVILITYNQEPYIERTLRSVLAQRTSFPFEIVIGDDASTDGTPDILRRFAREYPDVIRLRLNPVNKGLQANYFDALEDCRGRYLGDIGGDDVWVDADKLQKQVDALEADPQAVLCHTDWLSYHETTGELTPPVRPRRFLQWLVPTVEAGAMTLDVMRPQGSLLMHSCTWMLRRDAMMEVYEADRDLFRNPRYGCEDFQIAVEMSLKGRVLYLPDVTMHYSVGKPSTSHREYDSRHTVNVYAGNTSLIRYLQLKHGFNDSDMRMTYRDRLNYMMAHTWRLRDRALAETIALRARQWGCGLGLKSRAALLLLKILKRKPSAESPTRF